MALAPRKNINGTSGSDWIDVPSQLAAPGDSSNVLGGAGNDGVWGGAGSDWVHGGLGNDQLWGNGGDDFLYGEDGNDQLYGGDGNDTLDAGTGDDMAFGGAGDDRLLLGDGNNQGYGDTGADTITGGAGLDSLYGGDGNDSLVGGLGNDQLDGGLGNDVLDVGAGNNTAWGGTGNDTIIAGIGDDVLAGDDGDDSIAAGAGNNNVTGGAGRDTITAGAGNDTIGGGDGDDWIGAGNGINVVWAGNGNDSVTAGSGSDSITGDAGNDTIRAGDGNNFVYGGQGDDSVTTGSGADLITGDDGADWISAGAGNDTVYAGQGNDSVLAGAGNDLITGDSGNDLIDAGAGNDTVWAGDGDDTVVYNRAANGGAADLADGGSGIDTLRLELTRAEWSSASVQGDIARYATFLASPNAAWQSFTFNSFGLTAASFEKGVARVDGVDLSVADDAVIARGGYFGLGEDSGPISDSAVMNDTVSDLIASVRLTVPLPAGKGTLALNTTNGSFTYDPGLAFQYLAVGEVAQTSFSYRVTDADGDTGNASVGLIIYGANDGPVLSVGAADRIAAALVETNAGHTASGSLTLSDVDVTDVVTAAVTGLTVTQGATSVLAGLSQAQLLGFMTVGSTDTAATAGGKANWSFNSGTEAFDFLALNQVLTLAYTLAVDDHHGGTASQVVTITVTGTNDAPVASGAVVGTATNEDTAITLDVLAAFSDADGDTLTIASLSDADLGKAGTQTTLGATISIIGSQVHYDPTTSAQLQALNNGQSGADSFSYTVSDGSGGQATATVGVAVSGVTDVVPGFEGKTIGYTYLFPTISGVYGNTARDVTVGAGVEIASINPDSNIGSMDISNDHVLITFNNAVSWNPTAFNGFRLSDKFGTVSDIAGVTLLQNGNNSGLDATDISFDANNIYLNWQGLTFQAGGHVELGVLFA